jgi:hypothetical protein
MREKTQTKLDVLKYINKIYFMAAKYFVLHCGKYCIPNPEPETTDKRDVPALNQF